MLGRKKVLHIRILKEKKAFLWHTTKGSSLTSKWHISPREKAFLHWFKIQMCHLHTHTSTMSHTAGLERLCHRGIFFGSYEISKSRTLICTLLVKKSLAHYKKETLQREFCDLYYVWKKPAMQIEISSHTNRKLSSSSYIKCVNSMTSLVAFQTKQCIGRISFYAA